MLQEYIAMHASKGTKQRVKSSGEKKYTPGRNADPPTKSEGGSGFKGT